MKGCYSDAVKLVQDS